MTAHQDHRVIASRPVSSMVGELSVRPAGHTYYGHFLQRRRSRLVFV
jgi:hypothetical protein